MDWHGLGPIGAFEQRRRKSEFDFIWLGLWSTFRLVVNLFLLLVKVGEHLHSWERDTWRNFFFSSRPTSASMRFSTSKSAYVPQRRFSPRIFSFSHFSPFFQPIDCLMEVFNQWANLRHLKGGFHLRFYVFLLFFIFYLFSCPTLLEKNKIIFKCRNTSNEATCITGW